MTEYLFRPTEGLQADLRKLHQASMHDPSGPENRLLFAAMNQLERISKTGTSTKDLEFMPSYGDLSDCQSNYVGLPGGKPSHRIVWREIPPQRRGEPIIREAIAFGRRDRGEVYDIAAERLQREPGVRLPETPTRPLPEKPSGRQEALRRLQAVNDAKGLNQHRDDGLQR